MVMSDAPSLSPLDPFDFNGVLCVSFILMAKYCCILSLLDAKSEVIHVEHQGLFSCKKTGKG